MKHVLITGGLGDLGQALLKKLKKNYVVYAVGRNELDVTSEESIIHFFKSHDKIDIVINNAGSIHAKRVLNSKPSAWINDINVNLIAPYLISRIAIIYNKNVEIVNIASTAAYATYPGWSSYCASKAGVVSLTKCMAKEGHNVYAIAAGGIDTKFRKNFVLPNENLMTASEIACVVLDVLKGKYNKGVSIYIRKGEFEIK